MAGHYSSILDQVREKALQCGRSLEEITLVAVTKYCFLDQIQETYAKGCRDFGESRVQEALDKIYSLPADCRWHFVGSLQSNKVNKVVPSFCLIHSVDSFHLAQKISKVSEEKGVVQSVLLQVNTSHEESKHGLYAEEWERQLDQLNLLPNLRIEGLMTMAPWTRDEKAIRGCFRELYELRERWKGRMRDPALFRQLSMGMSNDFLIAVEEGATLLRVGSAIFKP